MTRLNDTALKAELKKRARRRKRLWTVRCPVLPCGSVAALPPPHPFEPDLGFLYGTIFTGRGGSIKAAAREVHCA
jgi:rRNA maturation protein Nop10